MVAQLETLLKPWEAHPTEETSQRAVTNYRTKMKVTIYLRVVEEALAKSMTDRIELVLTRVATAVEVPTIRA